MTGNPRVLIADDEHIIADTLVMILNQSGFEARAAYGGEMAVAMARNFQPDMLITDVVMPGLSGIDAAIRIRILLPGIKVLFFSGQAASANLLEKARTKGHDFEVLAKPVHPDNLIAKLKKVVSINAPRTTAVREVVMGRGGDIYTSDDSGQHPQFLRRTTPHGARVSFCMNCLLTVAEAEHERDLEIAERRHICNP